MDDPKSSKKRVSKLAIASVIWLILTFVCAWIASLLEGGGRREIGFFFWASAVIIFLIALVTSITALIAIKRSNRVLKGKAYAVGVLIISVIMLLLPMEGRVKRLPPEMLCRTNLNMLGTAMMFYAQDYKDWPTSARWCDLLIEKADVDPKNFQCREDENGTSSYAMNKYAADLGIVITRDMVLVFESKPGWNQVGSPELLNTQNHEGDGCTILFGDGHVEFVKTEELENLNWGRE